MAAMTDLDETFEAIKEQARALGWDWPGHSDNNEDPALTCEHCGHTGEDVEIQIQHVGGKGDVEVPVCSDAVACWRRWDLEHSLASEPVATR